MDSLIELSEAIIASLILAMSLVALAFAAEPGRLDDPGLVLTNMNRTLCGKFAGAYVTACCGVIDGLNRTPRGGSRRAKVRHEQALGT